MRRDFANHFLSHSIVLIDTSFVFVSDSLLTLLWATGPRSLNLEEHGLAVLITLKVTSHTATKHIFTSHQRLSKHGFQNIKIASSTPKTDHGRN